VATVHGWSKLWSTSRVGNVKVNLCMYQASYHHEKTRSYSA